MGRIHRLKILIIFHRIGPYHLARLRALSTHVEVSVIQGVRKDSTYAWDIVEAPESLNILTLYDDDYALENDSAKGVQGKIRCICERIRPDVLVVNGWGSTLALSALFCGRLLSLPIVLMSESTAFDFPRSWYKETIKSRLVKLADSALVGGHFHTEYLKRLGFPCEKIYRGYDVVDNEYFSRAAPSLSHSANFCNIPKLSSPYLFSCCRFVQKKNLEFIIKGFAYYKRKAPETRTKLILAGDGPLRETLKQSVHHLGLEDDVVFPGFLQYHELPEYYRNAQIFILASTSEQWGLVVNEAMASSLPVLVSNQCGCVAELVKDGVNGYSFDPLDIHEFGSLLLQMALDKEKLEKMGQESKKIIDKWTPATFAERLLAAGKAATLSKRQPLSLMDRILLHILLNYMKMNEKSEH